MKILKVIGEHGVIIIQVDVDVKGKDFSCLLHEPINCLIQAVVLEEAKKS